MRWGTAKKASAPGFGTSHSLKFHSVVAGDEASDEIPGLTVVRMVAEFALRLFARRGCLFEGVKPAEALAFPVAPDEGLPAPHPAVPENPRGARSVALRTRCIVMANPVLDIAQIGNSIVARIAVDVVDLVPRPLAKVESPGDTVSFEIAAIDRPLMIAAAIDSNQSRLSCKTTIPTCARLAAGLLRFAGEHFRGSRKPCQDAGRWVIGEQLPQVVNARQGAGHVLSFHMKMADPDEIEAGQGCPRPECRESARGSQCGMEAADRDEPHGRPLLAGSTSKHRAAVYAPARAIAGAC
ncbi:hypothetical protein SAMN06295937_102344 [Sphingopyxis flava]|uniref:Uncharacterized protein n=1 Tax=Sphingopyxis flava TaxID=1507287 RepID=A0A1T5EMZ3_9SPHN|nr:hypothetical protein [Sphingopyxis flava]SKB85297.1 hypothetical protein SAMN06295937_102344 [Sphingopyxis flava]